MTSVSKIALHETRADRYAGFVDSELLVVILDCTHDPHGWTLAVTNQGMDAARRIVATLWPDAEVVPPKPIAPANEVLVLIDTMLRLSEENLARARARFTEWETRTPSLEEQLKGWKDWGDCQGQVSAWHEARLSVRRVKAAHPSSSPWPCPHAFHLRRRDERDGSWSCTRCSHACQAPPTWWSTSRWAADG